MKLATKIFLVIILIATNGLMAQKPLTLEHYTVEAAPEWTDLFYRDSGWFGGDGIFSIALDGSETGCKDDRKALIYFSDSYVGEIVNGKPLEGYRMVNNSIAYFTGCEAKARNILFDYNKDENDKASTFFVPKNAKAKKGQYYWLGDGFVNKDQGDTMFIFAYHVEMTGPNVFDFKEPDVSLLAIPPGEKPPFSKHQQLITPLHIEHPKWGAVNFGAGIFVNTSWAGAIHPDGYVYVYGCMDKDKKLVGARSLARSFTNFSNWEYWDGTKWQQDPMKIAPMTTGVSNELSLTSLADGRYLLVFQSMGISEKVSAKVGASPNGPFGEQIDLWRTPEIDQGLLPYNAKAHPVLSMPGELLISYNTITFDFWNDIAKDGHIYRPRFIKLKFDQKK